jgi:hypothetical protein
VRDWIRRHPLAVVLPLEALLWFWHLALLAPWFDEADELIFLKGPLAQAVAIPASGLHPPLYFLLVWSWMRLPLGLSWTVQARTLSVLFGLAATVAADRWWARSLSARGRWAFLALWAASPGLLLYCRMARSYSLQLLLATVAAGLALEVAAKPSRGRIAALAATLSALLYVHYVPAAAILLAAGFVLARAGRWRTIAAVYLAVGLALLPWLPRLLWSLQVWGAHSPAYALSGSPAAEIAVKAAYWAMSLVLGEAFPDWLLPLGLLLGAAGLACLWAGARRNSGLTWMLAPAAVVGFVGVMRWVSYPFIPARMLFLLPMLLAAVVAGAMARPRAGRWSLALALAVSISGIWCYFHLLGFRNKQYPMPLGEIAVTIRTGSTAADSLVLVDSFDSDPFGLRYSLGPERPVLETSDPHAGQQIESALSDPRIRTIWFLRNTHDVSRGVNARLAARLREAMPVRVRQYEPFSALEQRAMRAMGMPGPPAYFTELLEFRR